MKNKVELKRCLFYIGVVSICFLILVTGMQFLEYQSYNRQYNYKMEAILQKVQATYPDVTEEEMILLMNSSEIKDQVFLEKYGINLEKDTALMQNQKHFRIYLIANSGVLALFAGTVIGVFLRYNRKKDEELTEITRYIEEINQKNYHLKIDDMSEDELSILKTEIYKTTVMLKETAEQSVKDKEQLKQSLSDISHQLKTPLTSIMVILDNLMDDPDMDSEVRADVIRDVKREIVNINFLVQVLLKLSKLDADTVVFLREELPVKRLIDQAVQNVEVLCDLKNVKIERRGQENVMLDCDFRWQAEALTNILKNCVEYSTENDRILITTEKNAIYTRISIRDFGPGIDEEDRKHIFERFYRGKNAAAESVGIGLALAKAIIKSDNGAVSVEPEEPGTRFDIKYFTMISGSKDSGRRV